MIKPLPNIELPNTISIDLEEYFHAENLSPAAPRRRWPYLPSRVEESTETILQILSDTSSSATFFILGNVARRKKGLITKIAQAGHEIASHGFRHKLAYSQTENQFYRDVYYSKRLLEDITSKAVIGYRAPNFSLTDANPWAHSALLRAGYHYDSSVYPIRHPRYSNINKPRVAFAKIIDDQRKLIVFPLAVATASIFGKTLSCPVAGGAYWRLLPRFYINWGLNQLKHSKIAANCYAHPWEFDNQQPIFHELSLLTKIRHYGGAKTFAESFRSYLEIHSFTTLENAYSIVSSHLKSEALANG